LSSVLHDADLLHAGSMRLFPEREVTQYKVVHEEDYHLFSHLDSLHLVKDRDCPMTEDVRGWVWRWISYRFAGLITLFLNQLMARKHGVLGAIQSFFIVPLTGLSFFNDPSSENQSEDDETGMSIVSILLYSVGVMFLGMLGFIGYNLRLCAHVPAPPFRWNTWFVGHYGDGSIDLSKRHRDVERLQRDMGCPLMRMQMPMGMPAVFFYTPQEGMPAFFARDWQSDSFSIFGLPHKGSGCRHHQARRAIGALFVPKAIEDFYPMLTECMESLVQHWRVVTTQDVPHKVLGGLAAVSLDMIGKVGFGHSFGAVKGLSTGEENEYKAALAVIMNWLMGIMDKMPYHLFDLLARWRMKAAIAVYNRAAQEIIEAETSRTEDGEDAASRSAVARLFRASKGAMSVEEIREHVISLLIAGHETTSNTAGWCCYLLAANPDTQEEVRQKLLEHWPVREEPPTWEVLKGLDFIKGIAYEALRFYPTVQGVAKSSPIEQEVGGLKIPPGVLFLPNKALWGKNEDLFPDPERFDPMRFSRGEFGARGDDIGVWGGGQRHCIGYRLAEAQLQVILAHVLRNFRITMPPGAGPPEEVDDITLGPKACELPLLFSTVE